MVLSSEKEPNVMEVEAPDTAVDTVSLILYKYDAQIRNERSKDGTTRMDVIIP